MEEPGETLNQKSVAKIELTIVVNKKFEFDIEDIEKEYPSILTNMEKKGMDTEDLNEISDYIFKECVGFILNDDNPLLIEEEIDEYWTTL